MSWVDSSVVSSSASRVFASSLERPFFFCSRSRRYFSISFLAILGIRAVLVGISFDLLTTDIPRLRSEREMITEVFPSQMAFLTGVGGASFEQIGRFRALVTPRTGRRRSLRERRPELF